MFGLDTAGRRNVHRNLSLVVLVAVLLITSAMGAFAQGNQAAAPVNPNGPLQYFKNYILTGGDYVVGGWQKNTAIPVVTKTVPVNGVNTSVPYMTGTVKVPDDSKSSFFRSGVTAQGVPANADVVGAFLYWQTVESTSQSSGFGQNAFIQSATSNSAPMYQVTGTSGRNYSSP